MVSRLLTAVIVALVVATVLALRPEGATVPEGAALAGPVRMIDADTLDVGEVRVRLHGVDAPEAAQTCRDARGQAWSCGAVATETATARWEGQEARCEEMDIDRYGRTVARCAVNGEDMGAALVSEGLALAYTDYSRDYVPHEAAAREAGRGLWAGEFQRPEDYRRDPVPEITNVEITSAPAEGADCAIKGNIGSSGRIYHVPGSRSYDRTEIDEAQGERWFCSEEEGRDAGWRPAR